MQKYSGADWVKSCIRDDLSELGEKTADLLGQMFLGIYHMPTNDLKKVKWGRSDRVEVKIRKRLSTVDFDELTRLVVLSHDMCLRVELSATNGGSFIAAFSHRRREGENLHEWERIPTLEDHVSSLRHALCDPLDGAN